MAKLASASKTLGPRRHLEEFIKVQRGQVEGTGGNARERLLAEIGKQLFVFSSPETSRTVAPVTISGSILAQPTPAFPGF